jgi:hypothetical protein
MANDPALLADQCTYMEAAAGDGGVHDPSGVWWLSPDIVLTGHSSGLGKADPGEDNTVDVTIHAKAGTCNLPPGTESITIDLFVGNPSLALAPNNAVSTKHVDSIGMPLSGPGTSQTYQFHWVPPVGAPATEPDAPGHKCLIARSYADPLIPSSTSFFAPDDPHVAQHNICVVPCGGPGALTKPSSCGLPIASINPDRIPRKLTIRAVFDKDPAPRVRKIVMNHLKRVEGFKRLATSAPRQLGVHVQSRGAKAVFKPALTVNAKPLEAFALRFSANLAGAKVGDAFVFHVTQHDEEKRPHGGLTVVLVV